MLGELFWLHNDAFFLTQQEARQKNNRPKSGRFNCRWRNFESFLSASGNRWLPGPPCVSITGWQIRLFGRIVPDAKE
jgi:hypothetical protein